MRNTLSKRLQLAGERFKQAVTDFLKSKGAVPGTFYEFQIESRAGLLHITAYETWVACRFDDVERAKAVLGSGSRMNPYSGKWNFHFDHEEVAKPDALNFFVHNLQPLLNGHLNCQRNKT